MNNKDALRLIIFTQIFTLFFLLFMPTLIRLLGDPWGKMLYTVLVMAAIGFALALRHAFTRLD